MHDTAFSANDRGLKWWWVSARPGLLPSPTLLHQLKVPPWFLPTRDESGPCPEGTLKASHVTNWFSSWWSHQPHCNCFAQPLLTIASALGWVPHPFTPALLFCYCGRAPPISDVYFCSASHFPSVSILARSARTRWPSWHLLWHHACHPATLVPNLMCSSNVTWPLPCGPWEPVQIAAISTTLRL